MGLFQAGFEVHGIDLHPQPDYPFYMEQGSALNIVPEYLKLFDFIWASPPCQAFTAYKRRKNHVAPRENLIPAVRAMLRASGRPYVIENVPGAPLENPITLCGSMFGLDVRRHRLFEASFPLKPPSCRHALQLPRFPQATNRANLRRTVEIGVWRIPLATQRAAMGIDWLPVKTLSQAIPPAYSRWIAEEFLKNKIAPALK